MNIRPLAFVATTLVAVALLSGCTQPDTGSTMGERASSVRSAGHNSTDLAFAHEMIAHHEQAIALAERLLATDGIDPAVAHIAGAIRSGDASEIDVMSAWIEDWNVVVPQSERGRATDSRPLLEQLIDHQADAIRICRHELNEGKNSVALKLAQRIIDAQTIQISQLEGLLAR